MTCNGCVKHVDRALRGVPGVTAVEVKLAENIARVDHEDRARIPALLEAIVAAGYQATSM
jgi:copper chaperone CopZ